MIPSDSTLMSKASMKLAGSTTRIQEFTKHLQLIMEMKMTMSTRLRATRDKDYLLTTMMNSVVMTILKRTGRMKTTTRVKAKVKMT